MTNHAASEQKVGKDIAADGLRGIASLAVFFAHFLLPFYPVAFSPWFPGVAEARAPHGWVDEVLSLPIISTVWNGSFAVSVFFVLSGYVLCRRFVDTGSVEVVRSMASRRYLRLGLPVAASVVFAWAMGKTAPGMVEQVASITGSAWLRGNSIVGLTFLDAVNDALYGVLLEGHSRFNTVFWTMRVELIGSFIVFGYALLSGERRRTLIIAATLVAMLAVGKPGGWQHYLAFLTGAWFAQSRLKVTGWPSWPFIFFGLYLGGFSDNQIYKPVGIVGLTGEQAKWLCSTLGAACVFLAVRGGAGRPLLESRPAQFLGKVSYALYLVHVPIVLALGCSAFWVGVNSLGLSRSLAVGLALSVTLPVSLMVAVIFERFIDRKSIEWGKLLVGGRSSGVTHCGGVAKL